MNKNKNNLIGMMTVLVLFLSVLILVSGCSPNGTDQSADSNSQAPTEKQTSNDPSPIAQIGQDQAFYDFYHQVAINQTKAEVNTALGVEPFIDADGTHTYTDPATDYALNVVYSDSDVVTMKILIPPVGGDDWFNQNTANVSESQVPSILEDMTYEEVKTILGSDGLEMGVMAYPGSPDQVIYLLFWFNPDLSSIAVTFDSDRGKVLTADYTPA